jgi:hypothetical protein
LFFVAFVIDGSRICYDLLTSGLNTRVVEAGDVASAAAGRIGRGTRLPPQLGQRCANRASTQSRQNVHSKEQIIASAASGGRSFPHRSQFGLSSSMRDGYAARLTSFSTWPSRM